MLYWCIHHYQLWWQVGELQQQLSLFWQKSKYKVGWNGAHNSFPHITLSSSFKCADCDVLELMHNVNQVAVGSGVHLIESYYYFLGVIYVSRGDEYN